MKTLPENLDLTVAQLCLTPQQLVLSLRHGAQDESGKFEQREVYHAMQGMLLERELRDIKVGFRVDDTRIVLTVNRVYESEGDLYRIVIASEERMANLSTGRGAKRVIAPSEAEAFILNLSRYLVFLKTGTQVPRLYTTYHVVSAMNEVMEQYRVEVPVWDFARVELAIKTKVLALRDAMALPDSRLPACSDVEKWVSKGFPLNCAVQCPARRVCYQKRAEYAKLIDQARGVAAPGQSLIAAGSGPIIVEDGADATGII